MKISELMVSSFSKENQSQECFTNRSHTAVQEFWNSTKLLIKKILNAKAQHLHFPGLVNKKP